MARQRRHSESQRLRSWYNQFGDGLTSRPGSTVLAANSLAHPTKQATRCPCGRSSPHALGRRFGGHGRAVVAIAKDVVQLPVGDLEKALGFAVAVVPDA